MTKSRVSAKRFAKWFFGALLVLFGLVLGVNLIYKLFLTSEKSVYIFIEFFIVMPLIGIGIFAIFIRPGLNLILSQDDSPPDKETEEFLKAIKK